MVFTLGHLTASTLTVVTVVVLCNTERLPPPTRLTHEWLDPFTLNVSWSWRKPSTLPKGCDIKFKYGLEGQEQVRRTPHNYFTDNCLTEESMSSGCNYAVQAISPCAGWTDSRRVNPAVRTPKPRAEVVKDFKCFLEAKGMNCSWIPVNRSLNLTLSYRVCGQTEERRKSLKECDRYYTSGAKDGCYLSVGSDTEICIHAATEAEAMTFKPVLVVHSPKLSVRNSGKSLDLNWEPLEIGPACVWNYELCFTKCSEERTCRNITREGGEHRTQIPYDDNCRYEFQSRVLMDKYCPPISSDFGGDVVFGVNKPPDRALTVVAIIVPIILSVSVVLACYCFRRHSHIIFPTIPDPRVILKGIMENGNKELKFPTGTVYTPEAEPTESCKLVKANPEQNL